MSKHYDVIHTETGALIGGISKKVHGWFFVSFVSSHKGSKTGRATAEKAFPKWAKKDSKMIERPKMKKRKAAAAEIIGLKAMDIKYGWKVKFRRFVTEYPDHRTETGVSHRQHSGSKIRVLGGVPFVMYNGVLEPITATLVTLDTGLEFLYDVRLDNKYLPGV